MNDRPVYLQIYRLLRADIVGGAFAYGSRLPSKRLLAEELGVSTVTTEHAYDLLCEEGYAQARERSGYFVIFKRSDGFAASGGNSSEPAKGKHLGHSKPVFPVSLLSRTMRKVIADRADEILERSPHNGLMELRDALRQYLARNRGINVDAEQIVVGSGAEYLCGLIVDLLGREKTYAIESPSYEKIEHVYRAAGVKYELLPLRRRHRRRGAQRQRCGYPAYDSVSKLSDGRYGIRLETVRIYLLGRKRRQVYCRIGLRLGIFRLAKARGHAFCSVRAGQCYISEHIFKDDIALNARGIYGSAEETRQNI